MKSFLMKFVFRINKCINFYFVCWGNRAVRAQCYYLRVGYCGIILFLFALVQEVWMWGEESIASFVFLLLSQE